MKLSKSNKWIIFVSLAVLSLILIFGCGNPSESAVSAVDSLKKDSVLVDSVKIDSVGKK